MSFHQTLLLKVRQLPAPHQTNGGTILGAWIFHRHGDRTPNRYLGPRHKYDEECNHWFSRIPPSSARGGYGGGAFRELSKFYGVTVSKTQNGGQFLDVGRAPFGFLSILGMDQMREVGRSFRSRYQKFGRRVHDNNSRSHNDYSNSSDPYTFLDHWNICAYSTNYLRTVMSAQCFLDGLIGTKRIRRRDDDCDNNSNVVYAGGGLSHYYKDAGYHEQLDLLNTSILTTGDDIGKRSVRVEVRDKQVDTLNAFDKRPQLMNDLIQDVIASDQFQRIDSAASPLAEQLCEFLPGLVGAPQAFGGTPSGVNWIHANDHFVCRRAHSVPLLAFSDFEGKDNEAEVDAALEAMENPVKSHLAWRFREWYSSPKLLALISSPPLKEILGQMVSAAEAEQSLEEKMPFVLYSCHDVTLLGLLYAIGADFLVSGDDCEGKEMQEEGKISNCGLQDGLIQSYDENQRSWRWWPSYSSTLAFELVKVENDTDLDPYFIRVVLNGRALKMIPMLSLNGEKKRQQFGDISGEEKFKCDMMGIDDFSKLIDTLEKAGGGYIPSTDEESINTEQAGRLGVDGG